jgi:type IV fimbrial biogenesis protein FimT
MQIFNARNVLGKTQHRGLTLLEILTVLAVMSVLAVLAAPSFLGSIRNGQITSATESLRDAVILARSEAIRRGAQVSLLPGNSSGCAAWSCGWQIQDANNNVLREAELPDTATVTLTNVGANTVIQFQPNGTLVLPSNDVPYFSVAAESGITRALNLRQMRICRTGDAAKDVSCPI